MLSPLVFMGQKLFPVHIMLSDISEPKEEMNLTETMDLKRM